MANNILGIQDIEINGHKIRVTLFLKTRNGKTFLGSRATIRTHRLTYKELVDFWNKHNGKS